MNICMPIRPLAVPFGLSPSDLPFSCASSKLAVKLFAPYFGSERWRKPWAVSLAFDLYEHKPHLAKFPRSGLFQALAALYIAMQ